jgi:hypothetical protein
MYKITLSKKFSDSALATSPVKQLRFGLEIPRQMPPGGSIYRWFDDPALKLVFEVYIVLLPPAVSTTNFSELYETVPQLRTVFNFSFTSATIWMELLSKLVFASMRETKLHFKESCPIKFPHLMILLLERSSLLCMQSTLVKINQK